jgi:SH3-like domain-containing protein
VITDFVSQCSLDGAVILELRVSPQATESLTGFFVYTVLDSNGQLLGYTTPSPVPYYARDYAPYVKAAKYPTYRTSPYPCDGQFFRFAQIDVKNGANLLLYPQFSDISAIVGYWNSGDPVEVLEQQPAILNGRVVMWYHLRSEKGQEGWSYGTDFLYVTTRLTPGGKAEVLPVTTYDSETKNAAAYVLYLRQTPEDNATIIRALQPRSQITLLYERKSWWFIRTADGVKGWIYPYSQLGEQLLLGLPWLPTT